MCKLTNTCTRAPMYINVTRIYFCAVKQPSKQEAFSSFCGSRFFLTHIHILHQCDFTSCYIYTLLLHALRMYKNTLTHIHQKFIIMVLSLWNFWKYHVHSTAQHTGVWKIASEIETKREEKCEAHNIIIKYVMQLKNEIIISASIGAS